MKVLIILMIFFIYQPAFSQKNPSQKEKSVVKVSFEVSGVCKMCKERIEEAAIYTRGVKKAVWEKETQQIEIVYNKKQTTEEAIHKAIANAGHDTSNTIADAEAYNRLPDCCRYKDGVEVH